MKKHYRRHLLGLTTLLVTASFLIGCNGLLGSRLTAENCKKIEDGMTLEQVVAILGEPTDNKSLGAGPLTASTVTWENEGMVINVKLLNNKVGLKACTTKEKSEKKTN